MQTQDSKTVRGKSSATGLHCPQAKELFEVSTDAVRELVLLHAEQFDSVITGDLDSTRFDILIHSANESKHEVKYAYIHHLDIHGCSKLLPEDLKRSV
jgi:hypothetical protein